MKLSLVCLGCVFAAALPGNDLATNERLVQGTWYCSSAGLTYRVEFGAGPFMSFMYLAGRWSPSFKGNAPYDFRGTDDIEIGSPKRVHIGALTTSDFNFTWGDGEFKCNRSRPAGDTDAQRLEASNTEARENRSFAGKWASADGARYVEFLGDGKCAAGFLDRGKWLTSKGDSTVYHEGREITCGMSGMYIKNDKDTLTFTYGMRDTPVTLRRVRRTQ